MLAAYAYVSDKRFDSLQADINLLNADVQALDYLSKPVQPDETYTSTDANRWRAI